MRTGMIALALGLLALRFLPALPSTGSLLLMPVVALMLLPFRTYPLALFLLGLFWACISAQSALNDRLLPRLDGQTQVVHGGAHRLPRRLPWTCGINVVADGTQRLERHHHLVVLDEITCEDQDLFRSHVVSPCRHCIARPVRGAHALRP